MSSDTEIFPSRVFRTGASGFIGRGLARHCRERVAAVCGREWAREMDIIPPSVAEWKAAIG